MLPRKVEPVKYVDDKLMASTYLPSFLEKYKLTMFLCHKATIYPRLIRMFSTNLIAIDDNLVVMLCTNT